MNILTQLGTKLDKVMDPCDETIGSILFFCVFFWICVIVIAIFLVLLITCPAWGIPWVLYRVSQKKLPEIWNNRKEHKKQKKLREEREKSKIEYIQR